MKEVVMAAVTKSLLSEMKSGKFFRVVFRKKNGEMRTMLARVGVKKHLRGGSLLYSPEAVNNLIVYSMIDQGYRTVNLDKVSEVKINGINHIITGTV